MAAQLVNAVRTLPEPHIIDRESLLHIGIVAYRSGESVEQIMDNAGQATKVRRCMVATVGMCSTLRYRSADVAVLNGVHYWNRLWRAEAQGFIKNPLLLLMAK